MPLPRKFCAIEVEQSSQPLRRSLRLKNKSPFDKDDPDHKEDVNQENNAQRSISPINEEVSQELNENGEIMDPKEHLPNQIIKVNVGKMASLQLTKSTEEKEKSNIEQVSEECKPDADEWITKSVVVNNFGCGPQKAKELPLVNTEELRSDGINEISKECEKENSNLPIDNVLTSRQPPDRHDYCENLENLSRIDIEEIEQNDANSQNEVKSNVGEENSPEEVEDTDINSENLSSDVKSVGTVVENSEHIDEKIYPDELCNQGQHIHSSLIKIMNNSTVSCEIDQLLSTNNSSDSEDDHYQNEFISFEAEEGEEDTPSEGSNDIIDVGEEINSTESDLSSDESYDRNSFIDDAEEHELLSGEEYDLSFDSPGKKKKSRIIQFSSGSDDEIIQIPKKEPQKKVKKSRIIKFSDSSDDEAVSLGVEHVLQESQINNIEEQKIALSCEEADNNIKPNDTIENQYTSYKDIAEIVTNGVKGQLDTTGNDKENNQTQDHGEISISNDNVTKLLEESIENVTTTEINSEPTDSNVGQNLNVFNTNFRDESSNICSKKNKRKRSKSKAAATNVVNGKKRKFDTQPITKMSIVEEAWLQEKNKKLSFYDTSLHDEWDVKWFNAEPSRVDKIQMKITCSGKSENNIVKTKYHSKDFKNAILYDSRRITRVDTKLMLKKKCFN